MEESRKYLAERLFSEDKTITYRILSRALKVHVNTAKGMLYDFHRWQNAMRDGTVHATYLLYGTKKTEATHEDGDVEMASSAPEVETLSEEVVTRTLALVPEEHLKDVLSTFEEITSFQVYSLAPQPTKDLQLLSEVSRQLLDHSSEDPVEMAATYGSIVNPNMRKRDRQGQQRAKAAQPVPTAVKPAEKEAPATAAKSMVPTKVKQEATATPAKETPSSSGSGKKGAAPPTLKRGGSSGIMSSFAKAAAKAPKPKTSTPSAAETKSTDALSDDGEDDSEAVQPPKPADGDTGRKSRKEREAELKRMMEEDDDEEDEEEDEPEEKADAEADEPMEEAPEPVAELEPEAAEVVTTTGDGRRRGKRRVMKKKQVMDDQGYLVTIQEAAWESFSEDEAPAASKPKPSSSFPSSSSQGSSKTKKAAGKGQGNIMSFFAKKG